MLYLYQYELNRWSKQDGIGQLTYEIKKTDLAKEKVGEVTLKKKLRPYDPLLGLVRYFLFFFLIFLLMQSGFDSLNSQKKSELSGLVELFHGPFTSTF